MLAKKITDLLNDQFNAELYSAYLYLAYADAFDRLGLEGFSGWYRVQSEEEVCHAMIIRRYLAEQGEPLRFIAIDSVSGTGTDIREILTKSLNHEKAVTAMIDHLFDEASAGNDHRTLCLLDWFIREQAEEEKNAEEMLRKLRIFTHCHSCGKQDRPENECGPCGSGLYALDRELAGRQFSDPGYSLS